MKCATAVVFCTLLSYSAGNPNKTECESHLDDASTSNKRLKLDPLEERKNALKMRSVKSYVSFMNGTELICCGVLHAYNRAIAATTCADKLKSRGLNNVTPVIGYSRGHNTQLLHIERVYELEEQTGLSFVFFTETVYETDLINRSPIQSSLTARDKDLLGNYFVTWSTVKNDYVVQKAESPFNYGGYVYSLMRGELALSLPTEYLNYILFRDGAIKGCSSDFSEANPVTGMVGVFIRYEPAPIAT